jgi:hypothetical protein
MRPPGGRKLMPTGEYINTTIIDLIESRSSFNEANEPQSAEVFPSYSILNKNRITP